MLDTKTHNNKSNYINNNCVSIQHEDNFLLLGLLLPRNLNESVQYQSKLVNKPKLMISIINQFKYTTELEFNYLFNFGKSEKICIKLYHDAKVAEMVYCTNVHQFIRLLGPKIPPKIHMQTRYALNTFLNKWLNYLLKNGYRSELWNDLKIRT
jgi:uncharacterized protein YqiB (DUF1249 family)